MEDKNKFEDEIDFKDLVKSPSRLFGWIFPYYFILFLIVGIYFVKHMNDASFNSVPPNHTDSLDINVDVAVKQGGVMPAVDLSIISNPSSDIIAKGKTLFTTTCSSCHGTEGKGDGAAAAALNPPPRNFHNAEGWTNGRDFNSIFKTLHDGVPGTGMIAYEYMSVEDRVAIIHFIRSLADFPPIDEPSIAKLDKTYELSKGVITPSNITLEMAANKISEENKLSTEAINNIVNKFNSNNDTHLVNLFNKYVSDKNKVFSILHRDFKTPDFKNIFISRLISAPIESGFKPSVSSLSRENLSKLYDVLINSIG